MQARTRQYTAKKSLSTALLESAKRGYYWLRRIRFWRQWWLGLVFDVFHGEYCTEGMRFQVPKWLMRRAHRARFLLDTHERDERDLVKRWLPADAVVLELGACLGVVSCVINRRLTVPAHHVAVEPNPQLQAVLLANRDTNGCAFGISDALVSRSSDGTFYLSEAIVMSSADQATGKPIQVPVTTVEVLEEKYSLRFNAIFMDIQGGELGFMRENPALLARCQCIILEFHPHIIGELACTECRTLMLAAGLAMVEKRGIVEAWACRRSGDRPVAGHAGAIEVIR